MERARSFRPFHADQFVAQRVIGQRGTVETIGHAPFMPVRGARVQVRNFGSLGNNTVIRYLGSSGFCTFLAWLRFRRGQRLIATVRKGSKERAREWKASRRAREFLGRTLRTRSERKRAPAPSMIAAHPSGTDSVRRPDGRAARCSGRECLQ